MGKKIFPNGSFGELPFGTKAVSTLIPLLLGILTLTGVCFTYASAHAYTHTHTAVCAIYDKGLLLHLAQERVSVRSSTRMRIRAGMLGPVHGT